MPSFPVPELSPESLKAIDKALDVIRSDMDSTLGDEFEVAGRELIEYATKDLKRGVSQITGELRSSIMGEITDRQGVDQSARIQSTTGPYNYAGRLSKDGSLEWRSGKYAGRKTFGWFHRTLPMLIRRGAKRYYTKGLRIGVQKLVGMMK